MSIWDVSIEIANRVYTLAYVAEPRASGFSYVG